MQTQRLAGSNRIETAIQISQQMYPLGAPAAVLVRSDAFPDALAAGPLANHLNAPILMTYAHRLHDATAAELRRLRVKKVVLIGGTSALSPAVEDAVAQLTASPLDQVVGNDLYGLVIYHDGSSWAADAPKRDEGVNGILFISEGVNPNDPDRGIDTPGNINDGDMWLDTTEFSKVS